MAARQSASTARKLLLVLHEIDKGILRGKPIDALVRETIGGLRAMIGCERISVIRFAENEPRAWVFAVDSALPTAVGEGYQLPDSDTQALLRIERGDGAAPISELASPDSGLEGYRLLASEGLLSTVRIPLIAQQSLLGCLSLSSTRPAPFEEADIDAGNEVAQHIAVAMHNDDMAERIRRNTAELERKVRERTRELEIANEELQSFTSMVAHDLRSPLAVIDGFSRAVLQKHAATLDTESRDYLERIRARAREMADLIQRLLTLSRIMRAELEYTSVDLSAAATAVLARYQLREPERTVRVDVQPDLRARGDQRLLSTALEHLIDNAWKFSAAQPQPRIEVGAMAGPEGERVYFVRDNGAGFNMAYADRLFDAFQRVDTAKEMPGAGVGLATVQRIIARHGGKIWARSAPDQGATFCFTLGTGA